jgi:1,2-diacylglycerol-3-alpha-glucose alpha-1,2-galactosyltransferase
MKIHITSETPFISKGNGVHTAFIDHVELLNSKNDIENVVNNKGWGDVFHCHTYGPYYFLKGLWYKGKRVHTVHVIPDSIKGSIFKWEKFLPFVNWYFRQVYSFSDVCIAISPTVEEAIKKSGAKTEIVRINNPVNVEKWKRTIENRKNGRFILGLKQKDFVVLGVGQMQARKGIEDFIDIAASMPDVKFVWAGGRPLKGATEGISRINAKIKSAPKNIQFTGMLELNEMPLIYAAADAMLFTSYQENCPLAPIEAAACGMPVIFRDIDEYKSLYEHPYLKANSNSEFIELTRKLIDDKQFYNDCLSLSKQLVTQFDREVIREKLINLYTQLNNDISSLSETGNFTLNSMA